MVHRRRLRRRPLLENSASGGLGSFWFEQRGIDAAIEAFPDNLMWETDYPHPTSQYPSPNSSAEHPADHAEKAFVNVPEAVIRKVVQDTPARLYGVEL